MDAETNSKPLPITCFRWPVRVYYEDTDAAGVVYYANYLRFLERSRTEWFRSCGIELEDLSTDYHVVFVVRRANISYEQPARLGDELVATLAVKLMGNARIELNQNILRGDIKLVTATVTLACVDPERWKPTRIPLRLLHKLEGTVERAR